MSRHRAVLSMAACISVASLASAASLTIRTGSTEIAKAIARSDANGTIDAAIAKGRVSFDKLPDDASLEVQLDLPDGRQLRLVDVSHKGKPNPPPMNDADKAAIAELMVDQRATARQFRFISFIGDARAAVCLVELVGDKAADTGDKISWRIELWRFESAAGKWQQLQKETRVLEKRQFESVDALKKKRESTFFVGVPFGLHTAKDRATELTLPRVPEAK